MMPVRQFALEFVQGAAVRAARLAQLVDRDGDARMRAPQAHRRGRAEQWQCFCADFDIALADILVGHAIPPGGKLLYVCQPVGVLGILAGDDIEECRLQLGRHRAAAAAADDDGCAKFDGFNAGCA